MGAKAADVSEICEVECECTVSKTRAIEWCRLFNNGETSLEDQSRSGRPSTMNIEAGEEEPQTSTRRLSSAELGPSRFPIIARHLIKLD